MLAVRPHPTSCTRPNKENAHLEAVHLVVSDLMQGNSRSPLLLAYKALHTVGKSDHNYILLIQV
jgi:hypothetical protein